MSKNSAKLFSELAQKTQVPIAESQVDFIFETLKKSGYSENEISANELYENFYSENAMSQRYWRDSEDAIETWAMQLQDFAKKGGKENIEIDDETFENLFTVIDLLGDIFGI